ncbi:hypothetical protein K2173_012173 [Erythroxylum novogranatense]|uniref:Uncharacterized protein n=1 Tax=Erythroxylum novogranatense TaxID=1862640 RepID=A0AAV8SSE6_9ROSI|nr:hypothetical protein K2173_012173 [Erythroxylum novogranatense]
MQPIFLHKQSLIEAMGNCLVLQENVIRVMKPDGKILEYKAPIIVQQVLSDFSGHAVSGSLQSLQHLPPETKLLGGQLYHLVPVGIPSPQIKKKVRFSIPEKEDEGSKVVRIKLVIGKKELQEMLKQGGVSVGDMISQLQGQHRVHQVVTSYSDDKGWKPALESITEVN